MSARAAWVGYFAARRRPRFVAGAGVGGIDAAFWPKLVAAARASGADPRDWAAVMFAESGIDPHALNTQGAGAVGINQFRRDLHFGPGRAVPDKTPDEYRELAASEQLDYVARFWAGQLRAHPSAASSARDLYWLNYKPATYVPNADADHVITPGPRPPPPGGEAAILYEPDGSIRARGLSRFLDFSQTQAPGRWAAVLRAIDAAEGGEPVPSGPSAPRVAAATAPAFVLALGIFGLGLYAVSRPRWAPAR